MEAIQFIKNQIESGIMPAMIGGPAKFCHKRGHTKPLHDKVKKKRIRKLQRVARRNNR